MIGQPMVRAIFFAGALLVASPAVAGGAVERLPGDWAGKGQVRQSPGAGRERAVCRLQARAGSKRNSVRVSGRCGTANGTAGFSIAIDVLPGGRVHAVVSVSAAADRVEYGGTQTDAGVNLRSLSPLSFDGALFHSRFDMSLAGENRFSLVESVTAVATGESSRLLELRFSRKEKE